MSSPYAQSLSQSSKNPSLFVPESAVCPPKLTPKSSVILSPSIVVPQPQIAPLSPFYFTATSSAHSRDAAAKMAATYATKGKKHVRFMDSDVKEDEADKDLEEHPAKETEATGSPLHSNA
ncbi:hypothetical protein D8674_008642 [Pyrus ussuriensis x Pyrus communis]|uniref:Uncharacterized protein n=1 Tax=Pyrus ussuriensis x Pyrus communis TaxID=2448454 RepID=A0A5N5HWD9_9ROSA|nr:hypothetical protein D8674_008642 [Pyrus ussuriensis x Pyrus communis]